MRNEAFKLCSTHVSPAADEVSRQFKRLFSSEQKSFLGHDRQHSHNLYKAKYSKNALIYYFKPVNDNHCNHKLGKNMKAIEACLSCEILISKHTPHGKKKKGESSLLKVARDVSQHFLFPFIPLFDGSILRFSNESMLQ